MSIFDHFKRSHRAQQKEDSPASKTAPGLRAIKDLWQIENKKPVEHIDGEVVTDIYSTHRPNGIPRRRNPPRRRSGEDEEYTPPF